MFAEETTHDLYSAIDLTVDKLEHQAQRLHERRRRHKGGAAARGADAGIPPAADRGAPAGVPRVVRIQRVAAKPMSVEEAVAELSQSTDDFLVFANASNERLAVLYRAVRCAFPTARAKASSLAG